MGLNSNADQCVDNIYFRLKVQSCHMFAFKVFISNKYTFFVFKITLQMYNSTVYT